jgi:type III restriction enzyme
MGTQAFEGFVRQLEAEGVGIKTVSQPPPPPVKIEPIVGKLAYDIAIPLTEPAYIRNYKRLDELNPLSLEPVYEQEELDEPLRIRLRMAFAITDTEVHRADIAVGPPPLAQELLASIVRKLIERAKLTGEFAALYPFVRDYVAGRCFGREIDLDHEAVRSHLQSPAIQEGIAKYLARQIGKVTAEVQSVQFKNRWLRLSETREFTWRRNLPLLVCSKTIFNLVATYNDFEKAFARFLDQCPDVVRFASLGTTEQDSGANFRVDYVKPSGAIGFYHPDWVVVQKMADGESHWIVETKGRIWEDTAAKDTSIRHWCERVSVLTGGTWRYMRADQSDFERRPFTSFAELVSAGAGERENIIPNH